MLPYEICPITAPFTEKEMEAYRQRLSHLGKVTQLVNGRITQPIL